MIKNFNFNDIVLYSKGWYQHSQDICEDLGYLLSKVYGWEPKREDEISLMMLNVLDDVHRELDVSRESYRFLGCHFLFEQEVRRRMSIFDVSRDLAIIGLVLTILQGLSKDEIELQKPHYGKHEHFRMGSLLGDGYPISMTYAQMNRMAEKAFGRKGGTV